MTDTNKFQRNTFGCELCGNSYPQEMKVEKSTDLIQCYDCLFSMNFNTKDIINGSMGLTLKQYLELATKYHDQYNEIPCNRMNDAGGCYICMNLLDIPFETFEETIVTEKANIVQTNKESSNKLQIEEYTPHIITIDHEAIYNVENLLIKI
jgi:hypothetical protein